MFDENGLLTNPGEAWLIFWVPLVMTYWGVNQNKLQKTVAVSDSVD